MLESLMSFIGTVNGLVWGPWTLYVLLGAGVLFTIWTRFCQARVLSHGVAVTRGVYDDPKDPGAINHFQALAAALSATIGLGNIGGVAVAVALGGPGAVFWMWVVGVLGIALKTVEITLTMLYRNTDDPDDPHGGAMWVADQTIGKRGGAFKVLAKAMGILFAATLLIMTMAGGNMFQTWNVADLTQNYFGVPKIATGIILAVLVGLVIIGGIKRIGHVAGRLVPVMCVLYLLAAFAVLAVNITAIPGLFVLIFKSAFSATEASGAFVGGSLGFAFQQGMKRALFSNEAGLGSAPIAHAAAKTSEPAREGIVGGLGPFIDTICICTLTALVILSTGAWNRGPDGPYTGELVLVATAGDSGAVTWSIDGPSSVDALPALGDDTPWAAGWQFFVLTRVPGADGATVPAKIYGMVEQAVEADPDRGLKKGQRYVAWQSVEPTPASAGVTDAARLPMTAEGAFRNYPGATLTGYAFDLAFPGLGKWLVTLAAWLFAISTMISWSYYGEQGTIYLFGKRAVLPYKACFLALAVVGSHLVKTDAELGALADFGTGGMLLANMVIVLSMGGLAVRALDDYFRRLKAGEITRHAARKVLDMVEDD